MFRLIVVWFILSFPLLAFAGQEKMIFAVDVIRHGDRTPIDDLPKNPYPWAQGLGQLTPTGMQQEFQLGKLMRKRYIEDAQLLPEHYQADSLYVRSSDFDRTLMSAESLLFALYPLGTGPTLPDTTQAALPSGYQPIPIHTIPQNEDTLLVAFSKNHQQQYEALLKQYVFSRPDWKKKNAELQPQFAHWSQVTGTKITGMRQLVYLGDTLFIRKLYHLPRPAGLTEEDEKKIIEARNWIFVTGFKPPAIGQYTGHALLAVIADYLKQAAQHKNPLKFVLFSAHDTTILSLMSAMGVPMETPPPYASDLSVALFEEESGEKQVRITLNGQAVVLPGCREKRCQLAEFEKLA